MSSDKQKNTNAPERRQLLEEIRRRAEEAEFKRLEDEDRSRTGGDTAARLKQSTRAPFPVTAAEPPAASNKAATEQKILVIRERLLSALERGKADKAAELFAELSKLTPDDPDLPALKARLAALQEEAGKPRGTTSGTRPRTGAPPAGKAEREAQRKKISDMLMAGERYYQQAKYEKAIQYISEVLNLDPSNEKASTLRAAIEKARILDEQIQMEEEMRRAEERASAPARPLEAEAPRSAGSSTDFWGASLKMPKLESDYDLIPEEKGPVGPPRAPLSERIVRRVSSIHLPAKPILTATAVVVLAVAAWFIYDTIRNSVSPARYSVLVLPGSSSGDSVLVPIAEAFSEDLISDMERVSEMRVIAPPTAFAFGASGASPAQMAKALGANYCLSWSLVRTQEKVTVQMSFSDTLSGKPVWSTRVGIPLRELPALKPEILRGLASGMGVKLATADGNLPLRVATNNEAAYDLYARGRSLLRRGNGFAPEEAIALFEQALQLDPEFGEAYSALAWAHMLAYETSAEMPPGHLSQALSNVQKALSTGLRSSEIFRAWGLAEQFHGSYERAIERFEQAVTAAPSDAEAQRRLALAYAATGRIDLALRAAQHSVTDDPGNITAHTVLGQLQQYKAIRILDNREEYRSALRAYEQGLRLARDKSEYSSGSYIDVLVQLQNSERAMSILLDRVARARESYVDYYKLGRVQQAAGRPISEWQESFVRAREILLRDLADQPNDAIGEAFLALVHTRLGTFKDAVAAIATAQQLAPGDAEVLYLTARMYAIQKDKTQALDYVRKALARRFSLASVLDMDYFNLYSEPEFVAALTRQR